METNTGKESIVSRLFGFGKKRKEAAPPAPEEGFSRTEIPQAPQAAQADVELDEPSITVPEQVIRIRTSPRKDDATQAIKAIGDSFSELTTTLRSVNDRLDRQDSRAGVLAEQLTELPEYLRTLPRLQEEQNTALRSVANAAEQQARAVEGMAEAMQQIPEVLTSIPDAVREGTAAQEQAIRKVAAAQQQTAKVIHHHNQRSLQAFERATKKSLQQQQRQMESVLASSQRMFRLAVVFMGVTVLAVVAALFFG